MANTDMPGSKFSSCGSWYRSLCFQVFLVTNNHEHYTRWSFLLQVYNVGIRKQLFLFFIPAIQVFTSVKVPAFVISYCNGWFKNILYNAQQQQQRESHDKLFTIQQTVYNTGLTCSHKSSIFLLSCRIPKCQLGVCGPNSTTICFRKCKEFTLTQSSTRKQHLQ